MSAPDVTLFFHRPTSTCSYVVADPTTREAAIVDPVLDYDQDSACTGVGTADDILAHVGAAEFHVRWILETHAHADHLSSAAYLKSRLDRVRVGIGRGICEVQRTFRDIFNLNDLATDGSQFDQLFDDGDALPLGEISGRVIATPGHTSDSVTYVFGNAAFIGDTLFAPDYGSARTDFPGGDAAVLYRTAQRLFSLPDDTRLYLCHDYLPGGRELEYVHALAQQRRDNIHLGGDTSEAAFVALRRERDATLSVPSLMIPAIQVNLRAGELPTAENNGTHYLKVPVNVLGHKP